MYRIFFCIGCISAIIGALLAVPEPAFAWGPGVHMVTGNWVLQNLAPLPVIVGTALMEYPGQFLHGCLSADIFIGKGSRAKEGHSHNWESGFTLLEKARARQTLAYAYGYLAHLAADTVAHNVFVPGLFHLAPGSGRLAHVFLEAQADRGIAWDSSDALGVFHERKSSATAAMLRASMSHRPLPFWIKSHLFQGGIALGGTRMWRNSLKAVDTIAASNERTALMEYLFALSTRAIVDVLQLGRNSEVLQLDPIGADALTLAETLRKAEKGFNLKSSFGVLKSLASKQSPIDKEQFELRVEVPLILERFPPFCTLTKARLNE